MKFGKQDENQERSAPEHRTGGHKKSARFRARLDWMFRFRPPGIAANSCGQL
ncbi:hypothetical protein VOM14_07620 [Paraburkholderia sp. MPAMCS5]|uniref:hypothetical protein n=1 Tax=Paraburkholderia sp. MPAMCS5 TaxID=3112563 RepID=UPI002E1806BD|nr:hypothetical protein [Paraburkholderia sp. MPAMCS5]